MATTPSTLSAELAEHARGSELKYPAKQLLPSAPVYVDGNDRLLLYIVSISGLQINVRYRVLTIDGLVMPFEQQVIALPGNSPTFSFGLPEGYLVSVTVQATGTIQYTGNTFIEASLVRSVLNKREPNFILFADYVETSRAVGWPPGRQMSPQEGPGWPVVIVGTDPAAGVEISETVPNGRVYELIAIQFLLITSAAAGTRFPVVAFDDGTNDFYRAGENVGVAPSGAGTYVCSTDGAYTTQPSGLRGIYFPQRMRLSAGYRFRTITSGLDAGDNYGPPRYLVNIWDGGL